MHSLVPYSYSSSAWTLGTIPPTAFLSSEVANHSIEHQDFIPPSLQISSLFSSFLPDLFCLDAIRICLCGLPATPYMKYKYLLLDLILFVQFNKKGFHTILSIYIRHDRLIPQLKLVSFQVVRIIVRTASTAYLQGDGSKDKKRCEVNGGKHAF